MSAPRLRVPVSGLAPGERALAEETIRYVVRVHRLRAGDAFLAFDPETALEADAELVDVGRRRTVARFGATRAARVRPTRPVVLVQCLGKPGAFDQVVRDATELGATRVVPVLAERSVTRIGEREAERRVERYRRIAIEAARQCGRGDAPTVDPPRPLAAALTAIGSERATGFCFDPGATAPLGPALAAADPARGVAFLVGPEGGLTEAELAEAERAGMVRVALGDVVLRTETVCAAVLGAALVVAQIRAAPSASDSAGTSRGRGATDP